jgi:hypothetical protein
MKKEQHIEHKEHRASLNFPMFGNYKVNIVVTNCIGYSLGKRKGHSEHSANTAGMCINSKEGISTLLLEEGSNFGTVAHESLHAVNALLDFCDLDRYEPELSAYLLGYISDRAFRLVIDTFSEAIPKEKKERQ